MFKKSQFFVVSSNLLMVSLVVKSHELNGINSQSVRAWLASASKAWPKFIKLPQP
jgi:hypothetical protein